MVNMTTFSVASNSRWTCSREVVANGQNVSKPNGLCSLTSRLPESPQHEIDTCTGVPIQGDCLRDFKSEISPVETNFRNLKVGDRFAVWNYEAEFNERHKTPAQLDPLRQVGDPLADECVAALGIKPGADAFAILQQYLSRPICENGADVRRKFQDSVLKAPDWVDWNIIRQGQQTFCFPWHEIEAIEIDARPEAQNEINHIVQVDSYEFVKVLHRSTLFSCCDIKFVRTNANPIQFVLLHYSLIAGFGAPRVARTLECTNYLSSSPGRCYQRLMETCQMVYDCMNGGIQSLQPQIGKGWTSVVRVRLLHSQVRLRIISLAKSHPDYYSIEKDGVPINQEDLVATLCAFSIAVIVALEKIGIYLSPEEVFAYLHLWRLVGHYMGILPENNPLTSREDALASFESIVAHLTQPDDTSASLARSIIRAIAEKPPWRQSFAFHSASARALLGEVLSNALLIETSSLCDRIMVKLFFAVLRWPSNPWWTRRIETFFNWFMKETATKIEMNFNMKVVPNMS